MNPKFIDDLSWEMAEVYGAITDQILVNLAHYFPYYDSRNFPRSSITYQADMLAQMGQVNKETIAIIRKGLKGASPALERCLEQVIVDSVGAVNPKLANAVAAGIFKPAGIPVVAPNQMRAFTLYYKQAADKLNLVNTVMLESTRNAYQATVADIAARVQATQTALDIGAGEVVTGVSTWNQATAHAIKRMQDNGITGFIDHAGHKWSAEAYVAMNVRTTMANTARAAVWETNELFGNDLYSVSYHNGARPLCYPWQNKVISSMDIARVVSDLDGYEVQVYRQSDTSYGEPAGLFGINCKHYPTPFIPGVSLIRGEPQSEADNARTYEESQEQRRLERKVREEKRDLMMLKAENAPEWVVKAQQERVRAASADVQDFCDQTGRTRHRDREGVYTERKFPAADTYDVKAFERQQKTIIDNYFKRDGVQQAFPNMYGLQPNETLHPIPHPAVTAAQADTFKYGKPFDESGYRKPQQVQIQNAKRTLANAPAEAKGVWEKVADKLQRPQLDSSDNGAYYSHATGRTYYKTWKKAFEESTYQRKNAVFFHEYGHNIDDLLGNGKADGYLSLTYKGGLFGQTIEKECEARMTRFYLDHNGYTDAFDAVKAAQDGYGGIGFISYVKQALRQTVSHDEYWSLLDMMADSQYDEGIMRQVVETHLQPLFDKELAAMVHSKATGKAFCDWVKSEYSLYERADISDMFERYMVQHYDIDYPFGIGHGKKYALEDGRTAKEAFAEMFSGMVTGSDAGTTIKEFFPEAWALFEEMLRGAV